MSSLALSNRKLDSFNGFRTSPKSACMHGIQPASTRRPTYPDEGFVRSFVRSFFPCSKPFFLLMIERSKTIILKRSFLEFIESKGKKDIRGQVLKLSMYVTFSNFIKSHYLELIGTLNTQRISSNANQLLTNQPHLIDFDGRHGSSRVSSTIGRKITFSPSTLFHPPLSMVKKKNQVY